jgi:hypothetical protein
MWVCVCVCFLHLNHATQTPHTSHNIKPITPFACFALFLPVSSFYFIFYFFFFLLLSCFVLLPILLPPHHPHAHNVLQQRFNKSIEWVSELVRESKNSWGRATYMVCICLCVILTNPSLFLPLTSSRIQKLIHLLSTKVVTSILVLLLALGTLGFFLVLTWILLLLLLLALGIPCLFLVLTSILLLLLALGMLCLFVSCHGWFSCVKKMRNIGHGLWAFCDYGMSFTLCCSCCCLLFEPSMISLSLSPIVPVCTDLSPGSG